ncbi:hypothetical protein PHLGIDRAFT_180363 [Phlebiopsis gigantea 11061_1 CR5-6]|uniref:JmjC domain-containing protein n=1 Tax=Phlebiopsis gigantea (strain 11061_1 CR5-6) TaxID=745531 RepID=A0A0C3RUQ6_PHLG1|nr:hypothetical protein PHLGIDRAFT_180363 [Phlebiopsis gigantea 11061_1 CR5-6]
MTSKSRDWALKLYETLLDQLNDDNNAVTKELFPCGEHHLQRLRAAISSAEISTQLDDSIKVAHEQMFRAYRSSQSNLCWRRLYTDACILRSLSEFSSLENASQAYTPVVRCISRLDQAIIIAGPAGEGRLELILDTIVSMQASIRPPVDATTPSNFFRLSPLVVPSATSSTHIPALPDQPSLTSFVTKYSRTPFILRGFLNDWPARNDHPWSSIQYLRSLAGMGRLVPVEVGQDYRNDDWDQRLMLWDEFLDTLSRQEGNKHSAPVIYLAQHDLFKQFPALRDDLIIPDYVYASPPAPDGYPMYSPPANDDQLVINTWLGPGGTVSPAHTDPFFNIYAQVVGRKTVWLAPPETSPYMYAYSSASDDTSQPHHPAANNTNPALSNTSRVDVFVRLEEIDTQFPHFREHVVPHAMCATLEPGDLLFFPPGWWHAMRSEETSFSVSMWF